MISLVIITSVIMAITYYFSKVTATIANVTSCTTDKFSDLLSQVYENKNIAEDIRSGLEDNYNKRVDILQSINQMDKN